MIENDFMSNVSLSDLFFSKGDDKPYPRIRIKTMSGTLPVEVVVEGVTICECSDLITGFALMLATYYVINISYPPELKSTLFFYQTAFLDIADKSAKDDKVSGLFTKLLT